MSTRELRRAEVLGRVKGQTLRLVDAAKMLELSYRQAKRLWQRYREEGAKGLQHRSAGRGSNRAKPEKFRRKVLQLIREKYSGTEQERFGPTLAAEHLADEDGLKVGEETLRRWMLVEGLWSRACADGKRTGSAGNGGNTLAIWCRWMGVSMRGLRSGGRADV
jgi:transposase